MTKRKKSLQWQLTIMIGLLLTVAVVVLTLLIYRSGVLQLEQMEEMVIYMEGEQEGEPVSILPQSAFSEDGITVNEIQMKFQMESLVYMVAVIILTGILIYVTVGRFLKPLKYFIGQIENISSANLSEPLEIPDSFEEITKLTKAFNEMTRKLNHTFIMQQQFSANAAHELRTPLTVLQTKLDIFRKKRTIPGKNMSSF